MSIPSTEMAAPQRHQPSTPSTSSSAASIHSSSLPETRQLEGVEALAGAVANALVQSFSSAAQNLVRDATTGNDSNNSTLERFGNTSSSRNHLIRQRHQEDQSQHSHQSSVGNTASTYELASEIRQLKRPRVTFEPPPSLFESERRRRNSTGRNSRYTASRATETIPKATPYSRNVILLPPQYNNSNGVVSIPRLKKRSVLGQCGLVGRVDLLSTMTELEVRREVCEIFSTPMGLTSLDLENGRLFPFSYLQNTGSGTHSYCVPSVNKAKFEWNGKQVASLALKLVHISTC